VKRSKIILWVSVLLSIQSSMASQNPQYKRGPESCFPLSNVKYEKGLKAFNEGLSEEEFNQIIGSAMAIMGPEVKRLLNKSLIIDKRWSEATVDAFATRDDANNAVVVMNGGLARHPLMTKDAFLLLICHEIGHHLGGAPKVLRGNSGLRGWSSAEGQADYYATSKCLPLFDKTGIEIKTFENDQDSGDYKAALSKCRDNACARVSLAGLTVSRLFASLVSNAPTPQLLLKDNSKAGQTLYSHPNPQCRLDTYSSGALCDKKSNEPFDIKDPKIGACVTDLGKRPACWFQEKDFQ
jgi:hypothetical protein